MGLKQVLLQKKEQMDTAWRWNLPGALARTVGYEIESLLPGFKRTLTVRNFNETFHWSIICLILVLLTFLSM